MYTKRLVKQINAQLSEEEMLPEDISTYAARHTNATLLLSLEVPIETVSKILGHSDIKTTQIYAKVIDKSKRDAVNKLNGLTG